MCPEAGDEPTSHRNTLHAPSDKLVMCLVFHRFQDVNEEVHHTTCASSAPSAPKQLANGRMGEKLVRLRSTRLLSSFFSIPTAKSTEKLTQCGHDLLLDIQWPTMEGSEQGTDDRIEKRSERWQFG